MRKFAILLTLVFYTMAVHSQSETVFLNKGWRFKQSVQSKWYKAEVPGTIHTDLMANGLIPDPFYRGNESKVQWVEENAWEYQTVFDVADNLFLKKVIELEFDGLDTYAQVLLNGSEVLVADNMFRKWNIDVKHLLKRKGNKLQVKFLSTALWAKEQKKNSLHPYPDNERVFVRKAQYQFGWDWGPRLVTCGIWKEVRLVGRNEKLETAKSNLTSWNIKLITEKDSVGESFYFTVNGKPTFIKGANWIPSDNFLPRAKKLRRYEQLIKAAKDANLNMLRVWGGGVYEDDVFYDLCDKYGIMVWQDFMFAGALYPADESFVKNVEEEVRYQVKRLSNHPCIAIWCGNNEIEEAWFNWGWQKQFNYSPEDSTKLWNDYKKIFHQLIPTVLKELDPDRPYWPSSPSLGWGRDSAYKKGDVHYWGVWWGKEPVEKYKEKVGRFVSEYGMQGMPDMKTIKQFSLPQDRDTSSTVMKVHQKHPFGSENIKYYIGQKFRKPKSFEDLVYVSQLMQADAVKTAIEAHRRNQPKTMGTLFWQWNDCWPVTSWSAVDYYGRKKALWYEVKRSFKDTAIIAFIKKGKLTFRLDADTDTLENLHFIFRQFTAKDFSGTKVSESSDLQKLSSNKNYRIPLNDDDNDIGVKIEARNKDGLLASCIVLYDLPKQTILSKPKIRSIIKDKEIELASDKFAYGVFIDVSDGVELDDNYFHLLPNEKKVIKFTSTIPLEQLKRSIKIKSLVDTY